MNWHNHANEYLANLSFPNVVNYAWHLCWMPSFTVYNLVCCRNSYPEWIIKKYSINSPRKAFVCMSRYGDTCTCAHAHAHAPRTHTHMHVCMNAHKRTHANTILDISFLVIIILHIHAQPTSHYILSSPPDLSLSLFTWFPPPTLTK